MQKSDLKNGTLVQLRDGSYQLFLKDVSLPNEKISDLLINQDGYFYNMSTFHDNMMYTPQWGERDDDIMRVYSGYVGDAYRVLKDQRLRSCLKEIWHRNEKKRIITIDGKDIEISEESYNELKKQLCD